MARCMDTCCVPEQIESVKITEYTRRARTPKVCPMCFLPIDPGDVYIREVGKVDGEFAWTIRCMRVECYTGQMWS